MMISWNGGEMHADLEEGEFKSSLKESLNPIDSGHSKMN